MNPDLRGLNCRPGSVNTIINKQGAIMHHFKRLAASTAVVLCASGALAQDSITVAIQLEPPNLDPTSGAAQAIDSVLYANVFEGLTRFDAD